MAKRKGRKQKQKKAGLPYKSNNIISEYDMLKEDAEKYYMDKFTTDEREDAWGGYGYGSLYNGYSVNYLDCHKGNTKLLSSGRGTGGTLYIGGWSRGAHHTSDMTVFDLTGGDTPKGHRGTWYSVSMEDFGVPQWSLFFWESMAMTIYHELSTSDVLITCQGGHGRSGMFATIIAYMLRDKRYIRIPDLGKLDTDPIWWMRDTHCIEAVETIGQELCVYETCLEYKPNVRIEEALEAARSKPRYVFKPAKYDNVIDDWMDKVVEEEKYVCPLCLEELDTMVEAIAHCNTIASLRYCPVCLTKHDLPVEAYNCCKVKSL